MFYGAGGLTYGLASAGLDVRLGIDLNPACRYPYEYNNEGAEFLLADISDVPRERIMTAWADADVRVLAGCAPCQPFSTYTQGLEWDRNDQWSLLRAFGKIAEDCKPDIVTMENVGALARHRVFDEFRHKLEKLGFHVVWEVLDCRNFGVPQTRRRLGLIASRFGPPELPTPTHPTSEKWITVRQAIAEFPTIRAGEDDKGDPLHVSSSLSPLNMKRIKASKPGGTWSDWPIELIAPCHKRKTGRTYPSVYGRMEWDAPSPTITGQCYGFGNGRFGHPDQNRAISLREAASLQTFPSEYAFVQQGKPVEFKKIGLMIGNAVPPRLGEVVGGAILRHVQQYG